MKNIVIVLLIMFSLILLYSLTKIIPASLFALATAVCSDDDFREAIYMAGLALSITFGVPAGWLSYALRRRLTLMILLPLPITLIALFGFVSAVGIVIGWKPSAPCQIEASRG